MSWNTYLSPLRYPGSKRRLATYVRDLLVVNQLQPDIFVEPFAGGASVSLNLLANGYVKRIGIADLDPFVASFWKVVFGKDSDRDWLLDKIRDIDVTVEQWEKYKDRGVPDSQRERALSCLFLNRTSFSGILAPSAGPIGGKAQTSQYPIDCRFPRDTLISRIEKLAAFSDDVQFVWNYHWAHTIGRLQELCNSRTEPTDAFLYFDPPFFNKAQRIYSFFFEPSDHRELRDKIINLDGYWLLSYDPSSRLKKLYGDSGVDSLDVDILYTMSSRAGNREVQEVLLTNLPEHPENTKLWGNRQQNSIESRQ